MTLQMPPLGCRLEVVPGSNLEDRIERLARYGFDSAEIPGRFLDRFEDDLRRIGRNNPLLWGCVSLGFRGSLVSPDDKLRRLCREDLKRLIELCAEIGAVGVNMPPILIQDNPKRFSEKNVQDEILLEELGPLGDYAAERNVLLLVEPVNRFETDYMRSVAEAAELCRKLENPAVKVTADAFHMQIEELKPEKTLAEAIDQIGHFHIAENTRVEPGPGSLDLASYFRPLKAGGYKGQIVVECRSLSGPADEVLPRSVEYIKSCWASAGD
jgi:sugar phosphate isomerase/epimerase